MALKGCRLKNYTSVGLRVYVQDSGFLIWVRGFRVQKALLRETSHPQKRETIRTVRWVCFYYPEGPRTQIKGL